MLLFWGGFHRRGHPDFDLYYYGGRVERVGSYTETHRVLALSTSERSVAIGDDVYGAPPLVALVFQPLSFLSLDAAHRVWMLACALVIVLAMWRAAPSHWPIWLLVIALVHGLSLGVQLGQPSLLTLGLILLAYGELRRGNERAAGMLLGVATAFKLYPAFLIVALVVHRQWRAVGYTIAVVVVLGSATVFALGVSDVGPAIHRTIHVAGTVHPWLHNQSIPGVVRRVSRDATLARWTSMLLTLAAVATLIRHRASAAGTFALAVLLMLLVQTISWEHYMPVAVVALMTLTDVSPSRRLWVAAAVGWLLVALYVPYDGAPAIHGLAALSTAPRTAGLVILAATLILATARRRQPCELLQPAT